MSARVLVVGCGVAGTAAAITAAAAGASVSLVDGGTGASTLAPGALDVTPWEDARRDADDDALLAEAPVASAFAALDAYELPGGGVVLPTVAGALRRARGRDRALVDLSGAADGVVLVPRAEHPGWDAGALARSWNDTRLARERGLEFVAVNATLTRLVDERDLPDADIAARHDDDARLAWLAARVKDAVGRALVSSVAAIVVPPWLGVERARAEALTRAVGVPCGEAMSGPGGPAGLRFEHARDRALAGRGVAIIAARVTEIARDGDRWRAALEQGEPLFADRVILAIGGLVGGGLAYTPGGAVLAGELPPRARESFAATIDAPLPIGADGHPFSLPGSLFGEGPEKLAWPFSTGAPLLERAGVLASSVGHVGGGLYVAGDLVADRPRTWLAALASGARAGSAAARA